MLLSASLGSLPGKKPRYGVKQARLKLLRAKEKLEREEGDLGELLASPGPDDEASTSPVARRPRRDLSRRDWPGESVESRPSTTLSRSSASRSGARRCCGTSRFDELDGPPRAVAHVDGGPEPRRVAGRVAGREPRGRDAARAARRSRRRRATLALADGRVHGWGGGAVFREAGAAAGRARNAPADVVARTLAPLRSARLIACGPKHAVVADGGVFTWGAGAHGRLGHGDGVSRVAPTRVAEGLPDAGVVIVAACGGAHCAVVVAARRRADGRLYTWGDGRGGQLGHGDGDGDGGADAARKAAVPSQKELQCARRPGEVAFFPRRDATVRHVACGLHHTLAVAWEPKAGAYDAPGDAIALTARLYAWGFGDGGRLGTGEVSGACRFPARVLLPVEYGYDAADDAPRPHVVAAAAGDQHSLALLTDGRVFAWGSNAFGQLGLGRASAQAVPLPERVGGAGRRGKVVKIAAGARHSAAAGVTKGALADASFGRASDEPEVLEKPRPPAPPPAVDDAPSSDDEAAEFFAEALPPVAVADEERLAREAEIAAAHAERDAANRRYEALLATMRKVKPSAAVVVVTPEPEPEPEPEPAPLPELPSPKKVTFGDIFYDDRAQDAEDMWIGNAARRWSRLVARGEAPPSASAPAASFDGEADDPVAAFMGRAAAGASYVTAPADAEADDAGDDREADDTGDDEDAAPLDPVAAFMARSLGGGYKT
ncbi:hypothetical protein JL720_5861 [Aureococcus anophagefferens]|nr:hypothetical protein JL720_5861 [Aureococcus anophagefferens]